MTSSIVWRHKISVEIKKTSEDLQSYLHFEFSISFDSPLTNKQDETSKFFDNDENSFISRYKNEKQQIM